MFLPNGIWSSATERHDRRSVCFWFLVNLSNIWILFWSQDPRDLRSHALRSLHIFLLLPPCHCHFKNIPIRVLERHLIFRRFSSTSSFLFPYRPACLTPRWTAAFVSAFSTNWIWKIGFGWEYLHNHLGFWIFPLVLGSLFRGLASRIRVTSIYVQLLWMIWNFPDRGMINCNFLRASAALLKIKFRQFLDDLLLGRTRFSFRWGRWFWFS